MKIKFTKAVKFNGQRREAGDEIDVAEKDLGALPEGSFEALKGGKKAEGGEGGKKAEGGEGGNDKA